MKYERHNPELFIQNRKRFARHLKPNSIAIFNSNDQMPRKGDQFFPFVQNADLFHLCGLDQEETVLVIFPDCVKEGFQEVAFIKKTNEHIAIWEGHKYTIEEAKAVSGLEKVFFLEDMDAILNELILLANRIYFNSNENDRFASEVPLRDDRFRKKLMEKYPAHKYHRAQPIMKKLRMIKLDHEVEAIQKACDITEKAFRRILKTVKPGVGEHVIEADIIHEFLFNRATGPAYDPIVASGANACVLHYTENNQICKDGDILLMDFGADYGNYAADLSRSIPVNGRFSERQKAVYNAVLRVMKQAKEMLVPGNHLAEYHKEVGKMMESELVNLKLLDKTDIKNQDKEKPAYKKYFMHGTSHHLGIDVHDLCNRYDPFQAGMVFTCEPGIYILEESLGIRLENDILVTDNGPRDLMSNIPIEVEELEDLMNN
jgi:Xaa-Pro aminopeptidase